MAAAIGGAAPLTALIDEAAAIRQHTYFEYCHFGRSRGLTMATRRFNARHRAMSCALSLILPATTAAYLLLALSSRTLPPCRQGQNETKK